MVPPLMAPSVMPYPCHDEAAHGKNVFAGMTPPGFESGSRILAETTDRLSGLVISLKNLFFLDTRRCFQAMLFTISLPFPEAAVPTFSFRIDNNPGEIHTPPVDNPRIARY